jgi:hypothetical protein
MTFIIGAADSYCKGMKYEKKYLGKLTLLMTALSLLRLWLERYLGAVLSYDEPLSDQSHQNMLNTDGQRWLTQTFT